MPEVQPDSAQTCSLLEKIRRGDRQALEQLLAGCRPKLQSFVDFHLDQRLRARIDPSDVVQETQLEVVRRMDDFLRRRPMPFHLWVRKTAYERMLNLRRDHRSRARRSVDREMAFPERSSLLLARPLIQRGPSPSQQAAAREYAERVSRAVAELALPDREILLMRHAVRIEVGRSHLRGQIGPSQRQPGVAVGTLASKFTKTPCCKRCPLSRRIADEEWTWSRQWLSPMRAAARIRIASRLGPAPRVPGTMAGRRQGKSPRHAGRPRHFGGSRIGQMLLTDQAFGNLRRPAVAGTDPSGARKLK